jgi:hypothetical protein
MVGARGFEPPTPWSRTKCATRLRYAPTNFYTILELKSYVNELSFFLQRQENYQKLLDSSLSSL